MSRETEKIFKEFHKYIEGKNLDGEMVGEEWKSFVEMLNNGDMPKRDSKNLTVDDYLDLACEAETPEEAIKYTKKALKKDKYCMDAKLFLAQLEENNEKAKIQLEKAVEIETQRLEEKGYFSEDNIGSFYGILETRPYMRARATYLDLLVRMNKIKKAVLEGKEMLRLNENDNLGVRYRLMALFAVLEDSESAEAIHKQYKEETLMMLLPLAVLYYKLDKYKKTKTVLKKLLRSNKDYESFLLGESSLDEEMIEDIVGRGMYRPGSIEEIIYAYNENVILSEALHCFNEWVLNELSK